MPKVKIVRPRTVGGYHRLAEQIFGLMPWQDKTALARVGDQEFAKKCREFKAVARAYCKWDLYFLSRFVLMVGDHLRQDGTRQLDHPWLFNQFCRFRDLKDSGGLDGLWVYHPRTHYKTTRVQTAVTQEVLRNQNIRIGYYSRTKDPMAIDRASGIRREWEENRLLHLLFPDVFWGPSPKDAGAADWGKDSFTVKRTGTGLTMSESTVRCCGIQGGFLYTGGHPDINIFDDCVDRSNSTNPDVIAKTVSAMSDAQKISDPSVNRQDWFVGTQYKLNDPYHLAQEQGIIRGVWKESAIDMSRPRPDLKELGGGEPVFLTEEQLWKYRGRGPTRWIDYCLQYLCDVDRAEKKPLDSGLLDVYPRTPDEVAQGANLYILMDPGGSPSSESKDYRVDDTAIAVLAARADRRLYLIDGVVDILTPLERAKKVIALHRKWSQVAPVVQVRIEQVATAMDADLILNRQQQESYVFEIMRIARGGRPTGISGGDSIAAHAKKDRIYEQLQPILAEGRLLVPKQLMCWRRGTKIDLVYFLRQILDTIFTTYEDHLLDALSLMGEPVDKKCEYCRGKKREGGVVGEIQWPSKNRMSKPPVVETWSAVAGQYSWMLGGVPRQAWDKGVRADG